MRERIVQPLVKENQQWDVLQQSQGCMIGHEIGHDLGGGHNNTTRGTLRGQLRDTGDQLILCRKTECIHHGSTRTGSCNNSCHLAA
jgi:hypothetical protein